MIFSLITLVWVCSNRWCKTINDNRSYIFFYNTKQNVYRTFHFYLNTCLALVIFMPLTVRDVLPPSGHEKNKRTEKLVDETGDGIALKHCQITLFLNISPHDRLCFPLFMQGDVCMLIICNYLKWFECISATNVYFAIKVVYFTIALFSLYLAHLNTFIYLQ